DGHGSHTAHDLRKLAVDAGIHCYCLPAHTTHKLQPLDVGVFGPLQRAYSSAVDDLIAKGETVTKYNVIETYMKAQKEAFKPETILSAFQKTGLRPVN
ncbi:CENP-B protein, partial [Schizopora paradoxa]